jgi:hypothetical protein
VKLSVQDPTVSRKKDGQPPVSFQAARHGVTIHNHRDATNSLTIQSGRNEFDVSPGEDKHLTESCNVEIGFNTSVRLTIEHDNRTIDQSELENLIPKITSDSTVSHAKYARSVAINLRKASTQSPNECLKFASDLDNFVNENPIDSEEYSTVTSELRQLVEKLETKVSSDALREGSLDEEQRERIDRIAHRVTTLYAQS